MGTYGWLILGSPLVGSILIALTWKTLSSRAHGVIGTLAIGLAFVFSVLGLFKLQSLDEHHRYVVTSAWDYASSLGVDAELSLLLDPLSIMMALVVTGVSTMIHLYSTAYMVSDRGYTRFFAYLNFFVFSMLLLVLAGNFVLLIVGWAFVGAASYLLISFWYRRKTATQAGIKAFVINVVGDVGLVLGTYFIFKNVGSVDFVTVFERAPEEFRINDSELVWGCVCLLVGAFAKSAQVPFHTWLPDAMEGPTPVSSLIHAATMVTAGVYLIVRMHPLFELAPTAADIGAIVGCVTLLVAATIGLVVTDLKRVIAYSTMSQIGYMIMAVSSAAYVAGMFHLMTHAFFKALLFMAAGSVIAAMGGNQDLDKMGGFRKAMPFTYGCMVIGGLALAGIPPFSGLFSKDEIIAFQFERGGWHTILGVAGYVGAFMTAVYTFRMIFRAFHNEPCAEAKELEGGHLHHPHEPTNPKTGEVEDYEVGFPGEDHHTAEREAPMRLAMGVLAVGATVLGALQIPGVTHILEDFLHPALEESKFVETHPSTGAAWAGILIGAVIGLAGIAVAYRLWVQDRRTPARIQASLKPVHRFFFNKWYFDELIDLLIVKPFAWFGRFARTTFERLIVDGLLVGGTTGVVRAGSAAVRALQSGFLRAYAALLLLGVTGVSLYFLIAAA